MKTPPTRPAPKPSGHAAGFTLVEILVSITIIIVLAVLVVVITGRIRDKAYQARAVSQIRQVGIACVGFSSENNGDINTVVISGDPKIGGGSKWVTKSFWGALSPYLFADLSLADNKTSASVLKKSLAQYFGTQDTETMKGTFQGTGQKIYADTCAHLPFAFNSNVERQRKYHKMQSFDNQSQTLYMTFGKYTFSKKDGDKYQPIPTTAEKGKRSDQIDYFPSWTAACVFLDGHIEVLSPPFAERLYSTEPPITD
jgi:type II secretory pathway pseudopilin PulG